MWSSFSFFFQRKKTPAAVFVAFPNPLRNSELEAKERPKPRNDYLDCYTGPKVKWEESHIRKGLWNPGCRLVLGIGCVVSPRDGVVWKNQCTELFRWNLLHIERDFLGGFEGNPALVITLRLFPDGPFWSDDGETAWKQLSEKNGWFYDGLATVHPDKAMVIALVAAPLRFARQVMWGPY